MAQKNDASDPEGAGDGGGGIGDVGRPSIGSKITGSTSSSDSSSSSSRKSILPRSTKDWTKDPAFIEYVEFERNCKMVVPRIRKDDKGRWKQCRVDEEEEEEEMPVVAEKEEEE